MLSLKSKLASGRDSYGLKGKVADNFSINDRLESEPTEQLNRYRRQSINSQISYQPEGGGTESNDTEQLNNDLLSGVASPLSAQ